MKRVLLYTDDFGARQQEYMKDHFPEIEIVFIEDSQVMYKEGLSQYDAILLDYGMMGDDNFLARKLVKSRTLLAWYGAMACRSNEDAKKSFPDVLDFQCLPSEDIGIGNFEFLLKNLGVLEWEE